jgi:hypothetical protein
MRRGKLAIYSVVLLCCAACTIEAQSPREAGRLTGKVVDKGERAPIPKSQVFVHRDGDPSAALLKVDNDGRFQAELLPGFYDVFVASVSFAPFAKRVKVLSGKNTNVIVILSADNANLERD